MLGKVVAGALALLTLASGVNASEVPAGYPADYQAVIDGSKREGRLVIYDNIADANWQYALPRFREKYPWITIEMPHLTTNEVHSRWEIESNSGVTTGDILMNVDADTWVRVADKMLDYKSPELAALPDFANPEPGIYVVSTDPFPFVYNTALLPNGAQITNLEKLAEAVKADPATFNQRVTTYDPLRHAAGIMIWRALMNKLGEKGWEQAKIIAPIMRPEVSSGPMTEKIVTGEYVFTVAGTGIVAFPKMAQPGGELIGVTYPSDATVVMQRYVAIPKNSKNVNSAKLLLDFILSQEGQTLLGKGGLTPYREDVPADQVKHTYKSILKEVPEEALVVVNMNKDVIASTDAFMKRWRSIVQK
ncbi:ABC transporter substrate-binding protein [Pseudochelatococcus lubricantis]|uniref:ABC transporter substrate-binding protein n=1 Tax=Pseudochelatococcus lubricantis TaxID=1538102 RepID=UPI0035E69A41